MRVKITKKGNRIYYEGRDRLEGEIIEMSDKQAKLNIKLGRVTDATDERPLRVADPRPVTTRAESAEGDATSRAAPKPRAYRRRDMTAEE